MFYRGERGSYTLHVRPISAGADGTLYPVEGRSDLAARVLHPHQITPELEYDILQKVRNPQGARPGWPLDLLRDDAGNFIGYIIAMETGAAPVSRPAPAFNPRPYRQADPYRNAYRPRRRSSRGPVIAVILIALITLLALGLTAFLLLYRPLPAPMPEPETLPAPEPQPIKLVEDAALTALECVSRDGVDILMEVTLSTGETYPSSLQPSSPNSDISFRLGKDYDTFTAIFGMDENWESARGENLLEVYADNRLIYISPVISAGDSPIDLRLNVEGCDILTFLFQKDSHAILADCRLTNSVPRPIVPHPPMPPIAVWLTALQPLQQNGIAVNNYPKIAGDATLRHALSPEGTGENGIVYALDGKYTSLTGVVAPRDNIRAGDSSFFEVYADGELIYASSAVTSQSTQQDFRIPLDGCDQLEIRFRSSRGWEDNDFCAIGQLRLFP